MNLGGWKLKLGGAIAALAIPQEASKIKSIVSVSLGIATEIATPDATAHQLVKRADQALYKAKQEGRDRYCMDE